MLIIAGILVVIIVGVLLFASDEGFDRGTLSDAQVEPIRLYLRECGEIQAKEVLRSLRENGGYLNNGDNLYNSKKITCGTITTRVIAESGSNDARRDIVSLIENVVKIKIESNCGLDNFRDQFNIRERGFDIDVKFIEGNVDLLLKNNIIVGKGFSSLGIGDILITVSDDINDVNELAGYIANEFSKDIELYSILSSIHNGVRLLNLNKNSLEVLGDDCNNEFNSCPVTCNSGCCFIKNKFAEENNLQVFTFGLRE